MPGLFTNFIDVLIPLAGALLVLAFPQCLTKRDLKAEENRKVARRLRTSGWLLLVAAALILVANVGSSLSRNGGSQPSTPTMHRVQAGTPDQSGWITAQSTFGRFSVKVPIPFNDFTIDVTDSSSLTRKVEVVGCKSTEGIKFSASKAFYKSSGTSAKVFAKMKSGGGLPNATVVPSLVNGHEACDIAFGDLSVRANQRAVLVGEEIYLLIVEWPLGQQTLAKSLIPTFFDSLRILE